MKTALAGAVLVALPLAALSESWFRLAFDGLLIGASLILLFDRSSSSELFRLHSSQKWLLLYLAVGLLSFGLGAVRGTVIAPLQALPFFARAVELLLLPTIILYLLVQNERRMNFEASIGIAAAAFAIAAVWFISSGVLHHGAGSDERRFAERLAGTLAVIAPLPIALGVRTRRSSATAAIAPIAAGACMIFFVALSGSRAALTSSIAGTGIAIAAIPSISIRAKLAGTAVLFLFASLFVTPHSLDGIRSLLEPRAPGSEIGRIASWRFSLEEFTNSPLIGMGVAVKPRFFHEGEWVRLLHETGLLGLFAASGCLAAIGRSLWENRSNPAAAGLLGALTVLALRSLFGSPMLRASDGGIFYMLFALVIIAPSSPRFSPAARESRGNA